MQEVGFAVGFVVGGPGFCRVGDGDQGDVGFAVAAAVGDDGVVVGADSPGECEAGVVIGDGVIDPILVVGFVGGADDGGGVDVVGHDLEIAMATQGGADRGEGMEIVGITGARGIQHKQRRGRRMVGVGDGLSGR